MKTNRMIKIVDILLTVGIVVLSVGIAVSLLSLAFVSIFSVPLVADNLSEAGAPALLSGLFVTLFVISSILKIVMIKKVKTFLKNVMDEKIFIPENVQISKHITIILIIISLLSFSLEESGTNTLIEVFDFGYLIAAFFVWLFGLVLVKANEIAEENKYTI